MLNERDAVVFVHPGLHPSSRGLALPWPAFMMEYLFDTTRAVVNLIFSGAIERFPRIRFILPHAGGLVPYFAWRLSVSPMIDKRLPQMSRDRVYAGLAHFWYDNALSPGVETFGSLDHVARPERIVFGTDYPFANPRVIAEAVKTHESGFLSDARGAPPSIAATRWRCFRSMGECDAAASTCINLRAGNIVTIGVDVVFFRRERGRGRTTRSMWYQDAPLRRELASFGSPAPRRCPTLATATALGCRWRSREGHDAKICIDAP